MVVILNLVAVLAIILIIILVVILTIGLAVVLFVAAIHLLGLKVFILLQVSLMLQ